MSRLGFWKRRVMARDLIYAPCVSVPQQITTASVTGGINQSIALNATLTGSNDWTNRQGAYKKFLCKSITVKITSTSISNNGVLAIGHNPNVTSSPGTMANVTDLKRSMLVQASSNTPKIFTSSDVQIDGLTGTLSDVTNAVLNGSVQLFMNQNSAQANILMFFVEITYHTYFSYLA